MPYLLLWTAIRVKKYVFFNLTYFLHKKMNKKFDKFFSYNSFGFAKQKLLNSISELRFGFIFDYDVTKKFPLAGMW